MQLSRLVRPLRMFARHRPDSSHVLRGDQVADFGRLPRYLVIFALTSVALWTPISAYVRNSPPSYTSDVSLILPGSGAQDSVILADLGQTSCSAAPASSSSRVSQTETYKRLLAAKLSGAEAQLRSRGAVLLGDDIMSDSATLDIATDPARAALFAALVELLSLCESLESTKDTLANPRDAADARLAILAPQASRLDDLSRDYQVAETVFSLALGPRCPPSSNVCGTFKRNARLARSRR